MGKHLHFDCFSGVSGDMILGALVDLGVPVESLAAQLKKLPIGSFELRAEKIMRHGIQGTRVHVEVQEDPHSHKHLHHILETIDKAGGLPERVARRAKAAFRLIAEAEAHVHGATLETIHFHEVGEKDAMLDVTGAMIGVELLGIDTFSVSPITTGSGWIECRHGKMPVPAPATAELLKGLPWTPGPVEVEMATPTGVAIVRTLTGEAPAQMPALTSAKIGYGGGGREIKEVANYLRLWVCESAESIPARREPVLVLECEIDDMPGEAAGYLMERLLEDGALDVSFSPVQMKKNRPGVHVRVIADPAGEAALAKRLFAESTTLGIRRTLTERWALNRRAESVQTEAGPVAVKVAMWGDKILRAAPEYESCRELAHKTGRPLAEIYDLARVAIKNMQ
ncbi:nickel pincer cofactor biosynthesis protein LarC [bacterium]|nr:nickel pincer cofactor biosynthesis protein LarC [bacterium]